MPDPDDRPTLRPKKYPELEAEREKAGTSPPRAAEAGEQSQQLDKPQDDAEGGKSGNTSENAVERGKRRDSLEHAMELARDRIAKAQRAGSYSFSGRQVSSDKIPATISTQPVSDSSAPRRRVSSTRIPAVSPPASESDSTAPKRHISSTRIPAVSPSSQSDSSAPTRRASSGRVPAASPSSAGASGMPSEDCQIQIRDALKHIAHKRYDLATKALNIALDMEPDNGEARKWLLICRARKLTEEGKREAAVLAYQELLEMDKGHYEAVKEVNAYRKEKTLMGVPFGRYFIKKSEPATDGSKPRKPKKSDR